MKLSATSLPAFAISLDPFEVHEQLMRTIESPKIVVPKFRTHNSTFRSNAIASVE